MKGRFLHYFFSKYGELGEPNRQGEYTVHCPFIHDKGMEQNPSAHVNLEQGVFHCKTCRAEGRHQDGGLSETAFIAAIHNISYQEAIQWQLRYDGAEESGNWEQMQANLFASELGMEILRKRGLTDETIRTYNLGFNGDGVTYPIEIFDAVADVRTYNPNEKPKMKSKSGATTLMFPFNHWFEDDRPTLLVGGENDALIGRQLGFNAVTFTGGEGSLPSKMFLRMFKGKKVYICYDCDEAGKQGAVRTAFHLREHGAEVYMIDLGLPGTKDEKDLSDFVLLYDKGYADVLQLMQDAPLFSEEEYRKEKNKEYPLVDLWETTEGRNYGRRMSSRVVMIGKYDMDMYVPSAVEFECKHSRNSEHTEDDCPLKGDTKTWLLNEDTLKDVLYLSELTENEQRKALLGLAKIPLSEAGCIRIKIRSRESLQKVIFAPDVESELDDNFRPVEQYAYVVGLRLNDGDKYRIYHQAFAHPKDKGRAFLVVDRAEASDNAVNTFRMTESLKEQLSVFQGPPEEMMQKRFDMSKGITKGFTTDMIIWGTDLVYHGPLAFRLFGRTVKGYPEVAIIGESRTGKSSAAKALQRFYQLGNYTSLKNASVAGLLGGADKLPSGGFRVKWGSIPRNHRGLMILDEMSGAHPEVLKHLTDLRSEGQAVLTKISGGKAPAQTRLLWIGNPRTINGRSKSLVEYGTGVDAVLDLVGSDEDVARFDAIMLVVDKGNYIRSDKFREGAEPHDRDLYVNLIRWVWSRTEDQIIFADRVEDYLWSRSQLLNESYATDVKLFGAEADVKLARFAVACAACCFSCDDSGESIVVKKEHVDWAEWFLNRCYDDDIFRLKEYAEERRMYNTSNPQVEEIVHGLMRTNGSNLVIRELLRNTAEIPKGNLESLSGLEREPFNSLLARLTRHYLVYNNQRGISATRRLHIAARKFQDARLKSLAEG